MCLLTTTIKAADIGLLDSMVMPGEVIQGHAKIEGKCKSCHKPFNKSKQNQLCLACHEHKAIAKDVAKKKGYHGRIKKQSCRSCHSDHKGRKAVIVQLSEKAFNHLFTDFPLRGGHRGPKVACKDCHKPNRKHRQAPSNCYACHKKDDAHKGRQGKACANCHVDLGWKKVKFDHSKTDFPLRGKHNSAECKACHKNKTFKHAPTQCYSCHRGDDAHKGQEGKQCGECHNSYSWNKTSFDHGLSRFPLLGKHARVRCNKCHEKSTFKDAPLNCIACHKSDDKHKRRLGTRCEQCHTPRSWKYWKFNHNTQTSFRLDGRHKGVACYACHRHPVKRNISLSSTCVSCHSDEDVHEGEFGDYCERCHVTSSFKRIKSGMRLR